MFNFCLSVCFHRPARKHTHNPHFESNKNKNKQTSLKWTMNERLFFEFGRSSWLLSSVGFSVSPLSPQQAVSTIVNRWFCLFFHHLTVCVRTTLMLNYETCADKQAPCPTILQTYQKQVSTICQRSFSTVETN